MPPMTIASTTASTDMTALPERISRIAVFQRDGSGGRVPFRPASTTMAASGVSGVMLPCRFPTGPRPPS